MFRERERQGEREGEKHPLKWGTWPAVQSCAVPGSRTDDLLTHRTMPSSRSHTSQGMFLIF